MEIRWWHKSFEDPKPLIRVPKSRHFKPSPNFNSSYQPIKHDREKTALRMEHETELREHETELREDGERQWGRELWMERYRSEGDSVVNEVSEKRGGLVKSKILLNLSEFHPQAYALSKIQPQTLFSLFLINKYYN